jgi:hypothetical protein
MERSIDGGEKENWVRCTICDYSFDAEVSGNKWTIGYFCDECWSSEEEYEKEVEN